MQNDTCPQQRLRSAWAFAQFDRVFAVCMKKAWAFNYPLSTPQRLWSDWAAQADLSLRWLHMPFCWFCHALTHISYPHPPPPTPPPQNSKNMLLFTNNKRPCQTNFHCSSYSTIKGLVRPTSIAPAESGDPKKYSSNFTMKTCVVDTH